MNFFNQKSKPISFLDIAKLLSDNSDNLNKITSGNQNSDYSSCDGFDPIWDDNLPDDYVFSGWGGLDDDE